MKNLLSAIGLIPRFIGLVFALVITGMVNAQVPNWGWAKSASGSADDWGNSVSTDANGNVLVTGYFNSPTLSFGTTVLTNAGNIDIFIVKYDYNGNLLWAKSAGGVGYDDGRSIATDASGNVFVTGFFESPTLAFDTTVLTNAGLVNIFIVKYDTAGNVLWAKSAGGTINDIGVSVTADLNGNVLVTGTYESPTITFGTTVLTNSGGRDIFIVKYDAGGNVLWAKSAGSTGFDYSTGISTDVNGNVFVTGFFESTTLTFGTTVLNNAGSANIFIAKYDVNGNPLWARSAGGTGYDYGNSVSADASGNVVVTGTFDSSTLTFSTTVLTNAGSSDIFIAKYDAGGNVLWAKSAGGTNPDNGNSVSVDALGNVLVAGQFRSPTITFGTSSLANEDTSGVTYDIFIVMYGYLGNLIWIKSAGSNEDEGAYCISSDVNYNVLITGYFNSSMLTLGASVLTNSSFSKDFFVAMLDGHSGQEEYMSDEGMFVYPNPTTGKFRIMLKNQYLSAGQASSTPNTELTVYNMLGKKIYQGAISGTETDFDLSHQPGGIYFVKMYNGKTVLTQKIAKQ
jgi:hypothetical protein